VVLAAYKRHRANSLTDASGCRSASRFLTEGAKSFVNGNALQAISGNPVRITLLTRTPKRHDTNWTSKMGWFKLSIAPRLSWLHGTFNTQGMAKRTSKQLYASLPSLRTDSPAMNQSYVAPPCQPKRISASANPRGVLSIGPAMALSVCDHRPWSQWVNPPPIFLLRIKQHHFQNTILEQEPCRTTLVITAGPTMEAIDACALTSAINSSGKWHALCCCKQ